MHAKYQADFEAKRKLAQQEVPCKRQLFYFNWDSLHARLNSHYEAWILQEKEAQKDYKIRKICLERTYS